jgi:hypothetical protein
LRHLPVVLSRWLRRLWRALRASAPKFWAINPAAVDLVDVEVEEITVDAGQAKTPSGCGALISSGMKQSFGRCARPVRTPS